MNFIVPLVVYPFDIMFSFGETDEQLKKSLKKYNCEWSDKMEYGGMGIFYINDKNQSLIRVYNIPKICEDYGTLQHEIFHAVTYILDRVGMKLKLRTSDEAYAYLIGYITKEVYLRINK